MLYIKCERYRIVCKNACGLCTTDINGEIIKKETAPIFRKYRTLNDLKQGRRDLIKVEKL